MFKALELNGLQDFCVFIGENGSGKSSFFDVFRFLCDALNDDVNLACQGFGGYAQLLSRGVDRAEGIEIEVKFRMKVADERTCLVSYFLRIEEEKEGGMVVVSQEYLAYKRDRFGSPYRFLDFKRGTGHVITNEEFAFDREVKELARAEQKLSSPSTLAIKGLGQFKRNIAASKVRILLENWSVSNFQIAAARSDAEAGIAEHLSARGDNLPLVTQFIYEQYPDIFEHILSSLARRVPGIGRVEIMAAEDGRVLLRFKDEAFMDPFSARHVSDGTIKIFAYLVLLNKPSPHPLLCMETPEDHLYPDLLTELVEEFRAYALRRNGGQVFVSTHSPDFLHACCPQEVFLLEKQDGYTDILSVGRSQTVLNLIEGGSSLGALWRRGLLRSVVPLESC